VDVAGEAVTATQEVERRQHAIRRPRRPARDARGEEQARREAFAVDVHERARGLVGRDRHPRHVAAEERGAVAARQRAGVGLHDAHEVGTATPGQAHRRDADGREGVLADRRGPPELRNAFAIGERGVGQEFHPAAEVHGR
jgi:hypothetical protein